MAGFGRAETACHSAIEEGAVGVGLKWILQIVLEWGIGIEPVTFSLGRRRSIGNK
jgi:hypothetical protein